MMKFRLSALAVAFTFAAAAPRLSAQAVAAATGNSLSVGAAYQTANPDYGPVRSQGFGIFANYDFGRYLGATAEFNFPTSGSDVVFLEHSYLVGGRGEYHRKRFTPYIKFLAGAATSTPKSGFILLNAPDTYPAVAFGGGIEYRAEHRITVRLIDFEQQEWLAYHPSGLNPTIFSFGAAYRFQSNQ